MPSQDRTLENIGRRGARVRALIAQRLVLPLTIFIAAATIYFALSPALLHPLLTAFFVIEAEARTHFCILKGAIGSCPRPGLSRVAALAMLVSGFCVSLILLFASAHVFGCQFYLLDYVIPMRPLLLGGSALYCYADLYASGQRSGGRIGHGRDYIHHRRRRLFASSNNRSSDKHEDKKNAAVNTREASASGELYQADLPCAFLTTTMCKDESCSLDCKIYRTPLNQCYNGGYLFPGDPAWGDYDVKDTYACSKILRVADPPPHQQGDHFQRAFFVNADSSCKVETDLFDSIPLNDCVGPFGDPRPWGLFTIVDATAVESQR